MNIIEKIKSLLQEAELYRTQSLLKESREKYKKARELVRKYAQLKGQENLLSKIDKRLASLEKVIEKVESAPDQPEMTAQIQDLIKAKFSFAADGEEKALEGAIALAKFGQYERALKEFDELIKTESHRMVAAKNIIRCHMSLDHPDNIISQYQQLSAGHRASSHERRREMVDSFSTK